MRSLWYYLSVTVAASATLAAQTVKLADALGDHMVLQRNKPAAIWGSAKPGDTVTVRFAAQIKKTTTDAKGKWLLRLDPMKACAEPRQMRVSDAEGTVTFGDILVGDVWIAGGQSNMGRAVNASWRPKTFDLNQPQIRYLKVDSPGAAYPQTEVEDGSPDPRRPNPASSNNWNVCTEELTPYCAAVGFFFAQRVHEATGVPQGLLWNAVGGSVAKEWIPQPGWALEPELAETAREVDAWYPSTETGRAAFSKALTEIDTWRLRAEDSVRTGSPFPYPQPKLPEPPNPFNRNRGVTYLYNGRLHPLVPYTISGIVWYQGESDYSNRRYLHEVEAMVKSWRSLFAAPTEKPDALPFYYVQMQRCGSYMSPGVRDFQFLHHWTIPNNGMAVLLDLDMSLHPRNKFDAGQRLALWAIVNHYKLTGIDHTGPIYKSHHTENGTLVVEFDHTKGGLFIGEKNELDPVQELTSAKLSNLEITSDGKEWVSAEARIDGDTLVVWAEGMSKPTHVRYCWKSKAPGPFLYNKASLPSPQFNTQTFAKLAKLAISVKAGK